MCGKRRAEKRATTTKGREEENDDGQRCDETPRRSTTRENERGRKGERTGAA
jgi:hypothetical protein